MYTFTNKIKNLKTFFKEDERGRLSAPFLLFGSHLMVASEASSQTHVRRRVVPTNRNSPDKSSYVRLRALHPKRAQCASGVVSAAWLNRTRRQAILSEATKLSTRRTEVESA